MAKGSASVTQKVAIINITYAHLKACKKIKERAFRLNTWLSELGAEGSHALVFDKSGQPISTRGQIMPTIVLKTPPPGFSDLATALYGSDFTIELKFLLPFFSI